MDLSQSPRYLAAVTYAQAGIPVFPCLVGGKKPATKHGFRDRSLDRATIDAWWLTADYNIGIVPEDAGWCVIDIDVKNAGFENWNREWRWKVTDPFQTIVTPSWGLHLYYYGSLPPSAGKLGPGIDTRGRDSYVLVPPSIINGVEYWVQT